MRTCKRIAVVVGLWTAALLLTGCSSTDSPATAALATVKVWAGAGQEVHVAAPGGGFSLMAGGRQTFAARSEDWFDLKGELVGGEGRSIELSFEIDTKRPFRLEVTGITDSKVQRDGQPAEPNADFLSGKYKVVVTGKLPGIPGTR